MSVIYWALEIIDIDIISVCFKVRMKDVDTKQEISFYPDSTCFLDPDISKNVAEVAAVFPNKPPLTGKCINNKDCL